MTQSWKFPTRRLRYDVRFPTQNEVSNRDPLTEVSFVPMNDVGDNGKLRLNETRFLGDVLQGYTYFRNGDVVVAKITPCFENGKGAIASDLVNGIGFGTTELTVLRPKEHVDSRFLYYFTMCQPFRSHGEGQMYGAGGQKRVPDAYFKNAQFPCIDLRRQQKIADFLDYEIAQTDRMLCDYERLIDLLEEKQIALTNLAVTRGIGSSVPMKDSGVPWIGQIPRHWQLGSLTRFAKRVVVGIAEAATHAYADVGVPILRSTNIRPNRIDGEILNVTPEFAAERASKTIRVGDLVTVRTGDPGVTAVVPANLDGCQCFTMLITTLNEPQVPEFFSSAINSDYGRKFFALEGWGSAQSNISVPILKSFPVAVPPPDEQRAIVAYLSDKCGEILNLIAETRNAISLLRERRSAIITAAITGQVDTDNRRSQLATVEVA